MPAILSATTTRRGVDPAAADFAILFFLDMSGIIPQTSVLRTLGWRNDYHFLADKISAFW